MLNNEWISLYSTLSVLMQMLGLNESIFWQNSQHLAPGAVGAMYGIDCTILRQKLELFNVHIKMHFKTYKN